MTGVTLAVAKRFSASRFWEDVRKYNVTTFQYVGEICRYLLAQPKVQNRHLNHLNTIKRVGWDKIPGGGKTPNLKMSAMT